jgi:metal iron transporter
MPHAIYVGTSLSRPRLYDFDVKNSLVADVSPGESTESFYRPSLRAIKSCLKYSIAELTVTLFTVAVFVNSALIIISGAAFFGGDDDVEEDLYSLYDLFSEEIAPIAGTLFILSLLFSGISCGIVATMAGQVVMEGAIQFRVSPFLRRLITRCVAIIPAMIVAIAVGREGLARALVACNYILAVGLIPICFPLVWYTCQSKYMRVPSDDGTGSVSLKNNLATTIAAWLIYALVVFMDIATLVLIGLGLTEAG